ncbi:MAG: radical SAM protein [Methanosarcinaceae archaeon]
MEKSITNCDAIPYFPFKVASEENIWLIKNPITSAEHEIDRSAYNVLQLCDGYHKFDEIIIELARNYQMDRNKVTALVKPLLDLLTGEGMLWWRSQRMQFWNLSPPMAVLWDLTSRCNLCCSHCVVSAGIQDNDELSLEECFHLIDDMANFGVQQLILSGGEPLMRPDFLDIVKYAASKGLILQIATNCTLITGEIAECLSSVQASAQVSLDGATPDVHDGLRQCPGAWQRTIEGIKILVEAGVPVMIAAVVTNANAAQIPALYELAADLGTQRFRILPFVPFGRGGDAVELEVSPQKMREITIYLRNRSNDGGLPVVQMEFECTLNPLKPEKLDPQTHIGCDGGIAYCTITSTGDVLPCNYFAGVETENVRENSFANIWKNSQFLNYFRSLNISDIKGVCQNCDWLSVCRGSCIAANFAHGDIFQANCHCWLVDALQ